jgi:hypothetical protein
MLNVQTYLRHEDNSLQTLQDELGIVVNEYDDRVVLNYHQIDSPRFHPVCDECRALILEKDTWNIVARSFHRFYNMGEGHDKGAEFIRLSSFGEHEIIAFDISRSTILQKLDGTLITAYWYNDCWNFSTRKMAFAEGATTFGMTFEDLVRSAYNYNSVVTMLEEFPNAKKLSWAFELTSPANRVVTPYTETRLSLLTVVHNETGIEFSARAISDISTKYTVACPYILETQSWEELIEEVNNLPSMQEGYVIVQEHNEDIMHPLRIKVKNPKFVAIAHMRENGQLSPKNVLKLVMEDEVEEYLSYFPEDKKYFDLVQNEYFKFCGEILGIYRDCHEIEEQKEFALTIQRKVSHKAQCGFLFRMRKGNSLGEILEQTEPKKLAQVLNLKAAFVKEFGKVIDEED